MTEEEFYLALKACGIDFATGVPCTVQKRILEFFLADAGMWYVQAAREEEAIGIATGAYLAGKTPIVLMQNSGLAGCINAIASLCIPYRIPLLLLVAWRGYPEDENEPPYHHVMGRCTVPVMEELGIPVHILQRENPTLALSLSMEELARRTIPAVMLLRRGIFE